MLEWMKTLITVLPFSHLNYLHLDHRFLWQSIFDDLNIHLKIIQIILFNFVYLAMPNSHDIQQFNEKILMNKIIVAFIFKIIHMSCEFHQ